MPSSEGTIKFTLQFNPSHAIAAATFATLNAWRQVVFQLGLTGRDPRRYGGLAYGNVSQADGPGRFIISGTQTGGKAWLDANDYCRVTGFDVEGNFVQAEGPIQPSSEALTHAAIYGANPRAGCVIHAHSPEIWRYARPLGLAVTDESFDYGTAGIGLAVAAMAKDADAGIIAMGGHRDGVIAYAENAEQAALSLVRALASAIEIGRLKGWL